MKNIFGLSIPQTLEEVCDPQRGALVVYDMQVGILSQIKNADQITRQVLKVLTAARDAGVRVFFSRHLSLPKELMGMFQFRMAMGWQRVDSPDQSQIHGFCAMLPDFRLSRSWRRDRPKAYSTN